MHNSMDRLLKILHRINKMYLTDEKVMDNVGELLCYRSDFQGPMDVIPVSDPEIFTDIQRFAQMQLVAQRAQLVPQLLQNLAVADVCSAGRTISGELRWPAQARAIADILPTIVTEARYGIDAPVPADAWRTVQQESAGNNRLAGVERVQRGRVNRSCRSRGCHDKRHVADQQCLINSISRNDHTVGIDVDIDSRRRNVRADIFGKGQAGLAWFVAGFFLPIAAECLDPADDGANAFTRGFAGQCRRDRGFGGRAMRIELHQIAHLSRRPGSERRGCGEHEIINTQTFEQCRDHR
jgi:hypothetical protein